MYHRTSFSSDEAAARDYLENLPPPPDDSQAPAHIPLPPDHFPDLSEPERPGHTEPSRGFTKSVKPKQRPTSAAAPSQRPVLAPSAPKAAPAASSPAPNDVEVTCPVGRSANNDEPEYPPPPPYTPPPLGPKPRPFFRRTGSKVADFLLMVFLCLCFYAPIVVFLMSLGRGVSGAAGRLFTKPMSTAVVEPTPASSGYGGGHTTNEAIGSLSRTVYWTSGGKSYHFNPDCPHLARSDNVSSGTLAEAMDAGKTDPCDDCVPQ